VALPGDRSAKKPMSNNTILKALERMGYKGRMTGRGFRGPASTILHEQGRPPETPVRKRWHIIDLKNLGGHGNSAHWTPCGSQGQTEERKRSRKGKLGHYRLFL
jgi:hypothetical protein